MKKNCTLDTVSTLLFVNRIIRGVCDAIGESLEQGLIFLRYQSSSRRSEIFSVLLVVAMASADGLAESHAANLFVPWTDASL